MVGAGAQKVAIGCIESVDESSLFAQAIGSFEDIRLYDCSHHMRPWRDQCAVSRNIRYCSCLMFRSSQWKVNNVGGSATLGY